MRPPTLTTVFLGLASLVACQPGPQPPNLIAQHAFHCSLDDRCPEVLIAGDAFADLGSSPSPFRGYGDPSLEIDASTGALWLAYSWLSLLVADPGPPPIVDLGVETHLARSDDSGRNFTFVGAINRAEQERHPDTGEPGWRQHEVPTLVRQADSRWQAIWLSYFDPLGEPAVGGPEDRKDFIYVKSDSDHAAGLGRQSQAWIGGAATSAGYPVSHKLSDTAELSDCAAFTEPALLADGAEIYLATNCVVVRGGRRIEQDERLVLLRQTGGGYEYVGVLLDHSDARSIEADRIEQADLARSRQGGVLLIVTPIVSGDDPEHQGCVVLGVDDLAKAAVRRGADGRPLPRLILTADGNGLGPGMCTYEPASETGVLLVIPQFRLGQDPPDIVLSLRATGVHP